MFGKIINGFKLTGPSSHANPVEVELTAEEIALVKASYTGAIRPGMWVVDQNDKIAIVENPLGKFTDIMYVTGDTGENLAAARVNTSQLTQARYSQIPEKRRPDQKAALSKGYFN